MKKALRQLIKGTMVAGILLGGASVASGQIEGNLTEFGGTSLSGATVEVWDSYPGGSILTSGTTAANGDFSLPAVGVSSFDLRIRNADYYPTVIRNLPHPRINITAALTPVPNPVAEVTTTIADFWGTSSTFLGQPIRLGDRVTAIDPDGVNCSTRNIEPDNGALLGAFLVKVVGDDGTSPQDEGAQPGDAITFLINGLEASPTKTWQDKSSTRNELTGAANVPGVTVVGPTDVAGNVGETALVSVQVTNTGTVAGTFSVSASVDLGWTVSQIVPANVGPLNPGESQQVDVLIAIPADATSDPAVLQFKAVSDGYQPATCGSRTTIDVNTTGIGDSGGDGSLLPNQFSLAQNFPNPFNPETQIAYNLRVAGTVRLEVFNIVGQSLGVLVDEAREAGPGVVVWDGRDRNGRVMPSGIYFYRLSQNGQSLTRKMVLMK